MFRHAAFLAFTALPATAQTVISDLNGDGLAERFTLIDRDGTVDLLIDRTGDAPVLANDIAWSGSIGQKPDLELAPNGSVVLVSMNESVSRSRWHLALTIAFRDGRYVIAGYTYDWYDTLDPAIGGTCDLNLLTGRGTLQKGQGPKTNVRTALRAIPVTDFRDDRPIPPVCDVD